MDKRRRHQTKSMAATLPFLTSYDPPGTGEGTLDPLGLYQIADQLAVMLVPAVRERMQRIRFLTAMAVGALVTDGLEEPPGHRDSSPHLAWEWMVVEALTREMGADPEVWGVPGTLVAKRAIAQRDYLDARSYLKTPRIFGFHGVYKRLAIHLDIVDVHLAPGRNAETLSDAWARGLGLGGLHGAWPLLRRWSDALRRSLDQRPPRTKPGWNSNTWKELAQAFAPSSGNAREKRCLRGLLLATDHRRLGALPVMWRLQPELDDSDYGEELLHKKLARHEPAYRQLLEAIKCYESFARSLQDAFDILKAEAGRLDVHGYPIAAIAHDPGFAEALTGLDAKFEAAHRALGEMVCPAMSLQNAFTERFGAFAEPMDAADCALGLCSHHEEVQRGKSADGKRPWFDRIARDRIYIRHQYREPRRDTMPGRYVHQYRGNPVRRFWRDLA